MQLSKHLHYQKNYETDNKVRCTECGHWHREKEETYLRVFGNIHVANSGGLIGNGNWDAYGIPEAVYCITCLQNAIDFQAKRRVRE